MSYLSVDLDFWIAEYNQCKVNRFFRSIFKLDVPITVVKHHQYLVSDINTHRPKDLTLYNVDYHADITSENYLTFAKRINCGNWADFIKWRLLGTFCWVYPSYIQCFKNGDGICDCESPKQLPFVVNKTDKSYNRWHKLNHFEGIKDINLSKVERVGIAISPDYYRLSPVRDFMHMLIERECPPSSYPVIDEKERNRVSAAASQFHPFKQLDTQHYSLIKNTLLKKGEK